MNETDLDPRDLLREWKVRVEIHMFAHNQAANRRRRQHAVLGGTAAILATIVGTAVFGALAQTDSSTEIKIGVGITSIAAAVCSALVTFANLPEAVDRYLASGREYSEIRRSIEVTLSDPAEPTREVVEEYMRQLNEAANTSLNPPPRIWERVRRRQQGNFTRWERVWARLRGLSLN